MKGLASLPGVCYGVWRCLIGFFGLCKLIQSLLCEQAATVHTIELAQALNFNLLLHNPLRGFRVWFSDHG